MKRLTLIFATLLTLQAQAITPWDSDAIAKAVSQGSWEQSEKLYRELQPVVKDPLQLDQLNYNLGVSLYQQKKYKDALPLFEGVAKTEADDSLKARALYDLGNTYFRLEKLDEAQKSYEDALLADPDDDDARYNIEQIQDKKNQQKNQQNNDKDKKNQDKDKSDQNKDKNKKDQDKDKQNQDQDKDKQDKDKENKDKKNQDGKQGQGQKDKGKDQQQDKQDPGKGQPKDGKDEKGKQSEEEMKAAQEAAKQAQLLEYFRQQEREGRPATQVRAQAPPVRGKTW